MPIYPYEIKNKKTGKVNKKYRIEFYYKINGENKQERKAGFNTKKDADNYRTLFLANTNNQYQNKKLTFKELYAIFIEDKKLKVKELTIKASNDIVKKHIMPFFENKNIYDITSNDIRKWQNEIIKLKYKDTYLENIQIRFSSILNFGVKYCQLPSNVFHHVDKMKNKRDLNQHNKKFEMLVFSESEFEKYISVIENITFKTFFELLYWTGLRLGEAFALNWEDIDFKNKIINVNKTLTYIPQKGYFFSTTKNESSTRLVSIDNMLCNQLLSLHNLQKKVAGYNNEFFVFGGHTHLKPTTVSRHKNNYCEKANVKKIRIHDFRHSHASYLLNHGINVVRVAKRLGHSDIKETLNTYAHLMPKDSDELMEFINNQKK